MAQSLIIAAFTSLFGVLVFVIGQLIQKIVIEPIQEQHKTIGEIAYSLTFLGNVVAGSKNAIEAEITLRTQAAELRASLVTIPKYDWLARAHSIPHRKDIMEASQGLIGWSNAINIEQNKQFIPKYKNMIAHALN